MMSKESESQLIDDIQMRMAGCRTFLSVPDFKDYAIDELRFLIVLLKDIKSKESLEIVKYIEKLIQETKM